MPKKKQTEKQKKPKKKQTEKPKKIGRTTKYSSKRVKEVIEFKRQCFTNKAICEMWGINQDTFYEWKNKHTEFSEAYKKGIESQYKTLSEVAKMKLYDKIMGFEYKETVRSEKSTRVGLEVEEKILTKYCPPDTTAILAALYSLDRNNFARNPDPYTNDNIKIVGTKFTRIK